jgi:hypothetical protein
LGNNFLKGDKFLKMIPVNVAPQHLDAAHNHFALYVRAGGPLPTLRIGRQPYGVLPVTRINAAAEGAAGWVSSQGDMPSSVDFDSGLHHVLMKLYDLWTKYAGDHARVPRIGASTNPEQEMLEILSMQPVSTDIAARPMVDRGFALLSMAALRDRVFGDNTPFTDKSTGVTSKEWLAIWRDTWQLEFSNRVVSLLNSITDIPIDRFDRSRIARLVAWWTTLDPGPLTSAADEKPDDYLNALCAGNTHKPANTLLHELLKRSLAIESSTGGNQVKTALCRLASGTVLHFLNTVRDAETIVKTITDDPSWNSGSPSAYGIRLSLARRILEERARQTDHQFPSLAEIDTIYGIGEDTFHDITHALKGQSVSADIDYLFRQTLDLLSHRLDAWFTSFATKRLESMRTRAETGVHIGAYGYLEDLDLSGVTIESAGYIHTPSASQTAAASVLYNAYLSHEAVSAQGHPFHLNLTSDRVNRALQLLQGVREGQTLGARLGYQFERGLHIRKDRPNQYLDQYIDDFRETFPIVANKLTDSANGESVETVAARNVVDGTALAAAWRAKGDGIRDEVVERLDKVLNKVDAGDRNSVEQELRRLLDSTDAVGDLLMYESVYHTVAGNYDPAGAAFEAASGKGHLPEISSMKTRVNASVLDHRVVMFLPISDEAKDAKNTGPRSLAEPTLASWIAGLLPPLNQIGCSYFLLDEDGNEHTPGDPHVSLEDLNISAIDFFYLSTLPPQGEEIELERRVRRVARARGEKVTLKQRIKLDLTKPDGFAVGFDEAAEFARITFALVSQSAALDPAALALPTEAETAHYDIVEANRLYDHLNNARERLKELGEQLSRLLPAQPRDDIEPELNDNERAAIDQLLLELSRFGLPGAVALGQDDPGLLPLARGVLKDVKERVQSAQDITDPGQALEGTKLDLYVSSCVEALKQLFGRYFIVLPSFMPAGMSSIRESMGDRELLGVTDGHRVRLWLQQEAEVHPALERLEDWLIVTEAWGQATTGLSKIELGVAQLPHEPGRRWLGLTDSERNQQQRDRNALSIVVVGDNLTELVGNNGTRRVTGLVIHRCQDRVPRAKVDTSVGFHYDAPSAQAPQCLLLAVPSRITDPPGAWSEDELEAIVRSAMDLAKIRAVDLDALSAPDPDAQFAANYRPVGVGALIPALFIPVDHSRPGSSEEPVAKAVEDWIGGRGRRR